MDHRDDVSAHSNSSYHTPPEVGDAIRAQPDNTATLQIGGDEGFEIPVTVEEPWNNELEKHLRDWQAQAETKAREHDAAGYRLKFKHQLIGILTIAHSSIVFICSGVIGCSDAFNYRLIMAIVSGLSVFWSTVYTQLNLGSVYRQHFFYMEQYSSYAEDIKTMLIRDRDFRVPADAFIMEMRERLKKLYMEPELPRSRFFLC